MANFNEEDEIDPVFVNMNNFHRISSPTQTFNQHLPYDQTLANDYDIYNGFNRLSISSSSVPSHLQQLPHVVPPLPYTQTNVVNGVVNGGSPFGNHINNDPSMLMNNQGFTPQYSHGGIDDQMKLRYEDYNRALVFMRGYSSAPVSPQGFGGFSVPRFNSNSVFNSVDSPVSSGCTCGDSYCRSQSRVQSPPELSQRFRTRSGSNLNGFRLDSGRNRVRGGGGGLNGSSGLNLDMDYLNMARTQLYTRQLQLLLQNPNAFLQLKGQLLALAKDQHGCRFLQKKFEEGSVDEIQMIFSELKSHVSELMVDPFGNYLVQKLLEVCNEDQMTELVTFATRDQYEFVKICLSTHGTRSVQKLLGLLKTPQQIARIMSALRNGTVLLTKDPNGHHVIQHCLKHFSNEENKYLFNAISDHCVEIAMDRSGCCVLQQCVQRGDGELRDRFVAEISSNALVLAQDPFGNYVVQYLVGMHVKHITRDLVRQLKGSFEALATQKFSSNLVEKFIRESEKEESIEVTKELLYDSNLLMILQDQYGNYVMQTALKYGHMFNAIVKVIEVNFQSLRNHPYGKRVITAMNGVMKSQQQHHQHHQHNYQYHI